MTISTAQYLNMRSALLGKLAGNVPGVANPSNAEVLGFMAQLLTDSVGAAALSARQQVAMDTAMLGILTSNNASAANPSAAQVGDFWTQVATDSSGATLLTADRYSKLRSVFKDVVSNNYPGTINPTVGDLYSYFATYAYGFATDPQLMSWWRPDTGYVNRVTTNNVFGDLLESGGVVASNATAGPDSTPVYRLDISTGGVLRTTNITAPNAGPFQIIVVLKCRDGAPAFAKYYSAVNGGAKLSYFPTAITVQAGTTVSTPQTVTAFHSFDAIFWGSTAGGISVDGAAYVNGNVAGANAAGFYIGADQDGVSLRSTIDIADILIIEGRMSAQMHASVYAYLRGRYPSLGIAVPAYVADHATNVPPWTYTSPWDAWLVAGQSNAQGLGTSAATAFNANEFALGYDWTWKIAVDPITSSTLQRDTVDNGSAAATHAGHATFANSMQPYYGRPLAIIPVCAGGSYVTPGLVGASDYNIWTPSFPRGNKLPNSLYGSLLARAREVIYRGGTIRGMIWHQGEAEATLVDTVQQDLWVSRVQTIIDSLRADLGLPNLPVLYAQIQPAPSATWIRMRTTVQPLLASSNQKMVSVPDGAYIAASAVDHLHLDTVGAPGGLEGFYSACATTAQANGY